MKKTIHNESYKNIINELRSYREKNNIKQSDLAKNIDRDQTFISKVENFERRIDVIEFIEICKQLKLSAINILKRNTDIE